MSEFRVKNKERLDIRTIQLNNSRGFYHSFNFQFINALKENLFRYTLASPEQELIDKQPIYNTSSSR
jgi:hypothetical protein